MTFNLSFFSGQIQRCVKVQNSAVLPSARDDVTVLQNTYRENRSFMEIPH